MPYKDPEKQREARRAYRVRKGLAIADLSEIIGDRPLNRDVLLQALGIRAREGCVPAMRLLLEEYRREGSEQPSTSVTGELAERRR
jgi:hypothetical protein